MPQFFDLLGGTSIGGLITSILSIPSDDEPTNRAKPKWSTVQCLDLMTTQGDVIFQADDMSTGMRVFWCILITLFGAIIFYLIGHKCFVNSEFEK